MVSFFHKGVVGLILSFIGGFSVYAQNTTESPTSSGDSAITYEMPQVSIFQKSYGLFSNVPGSAGYLDETFLKRIQPLSGNEVIRKIPGIHVVDEEGVGLRANIGIRGLDPDRSRSVLILEDGIPVALNPYGEPEMYYTPSMDRMQGVEVLKGSGQILFGPQTIGGVINYITADPPESSSGNASVIGGEGGFFRGLFSYGNTSGNAGFKVNYLRKQAENIGPTAFRINDLSTKIKLKSGNSSLGLKLGYYDEISNSTYIGLTQTMYDQGGQDFVQMAPDDRLDIRRYSASLVHENRISSHFHLKTIAFGYTTTRDWQRQDFSSNPLVSNRSGVVWGDTSVAGGAVYMRDQNAHRNRAFEVAGIETQLTTTFATGKVQHKLQSGIRYMYERAFEQRINGNKKDAASGELVSDEIRTGNALSGFFQDKIYLSSKLSATGGIRMEYYNYERNIIRDGDTDTSIVAISEVGKVIPGFGLNYQAGEILTLFTGIHRGFAPPRVKDAISDNGVVYNLNPELSWNGEAGFRLAIQKSFFAEVTGFYMKFSNQIIPVSESSGGTGAGLVNGGETQHTGIEMAFSANFAPILNLKGYYLGLTANFTFVKATFSQDRFIVSGGEKININGNRTPYSPAIFITHSVSFETPSGWGISFNGNYTGKQFSNELNSIETSPDGRIGLIPSFFTLDGSMYYTLPRIPLIFRVSGKNLTNERYIVSRRPQGIRVGLPRYLSAGLEISF
ncbi:MAG: TonB-dependent receptor [Bacteroidia bacterium]|nr:TonB-dependent receptor [Bacteroidia bacterium]